MTTKDDLDDDAPDNAERDADDAEADQAESVDADSDAGEPEGSAAEDSEASQAEAGGGESEDAEASPRLRTRKKKRKKKRAAPARYDYAERRQALEGRWTGGHLFLTAIIALGIGAFAGYNLRGDGSSDGSDTTGAALSTDPVSGNPVSPVASAAPAAPAGADKYGRAPGSEHFGHDHPLDGGPAAPAAPAAPAPAGTGPDKFGRTPGSEHYGHNHE